VHQRNNKSSTSVGSRRKLSLLIKCARSDSAFFSEHDQMQRFHAKALVSHFPFWCNANIFGCWPSHVTGSLPLTRFVTRFLKLFPIQLKTARVIYFLLGSLVLVFPSFSNGPYVTSSRRCDVIADVIRLVTVRLLLAVGSSIGTGSPGHI